MESFLHIILGPRMKSVRIGGTVFPNLANLLVNPLTGWLTHLLPFKAVSPGNVKYNDELKKGDSCESG